MTDFRIVIVASFIIEFIIAYRYFDALFVSKYKKAITFSLSLLGYIVLTLCFIPSSLLINSIMFFVINGLICSLLYKVKITTIIFHVVMMSMFLFFSECVTVIFLVAFFKDLSPYTTDPYLNIMIFLISKFSYFILIQILILIFSRKKNITHKQAKHEWCLWVNSFVTFILYFVLTSIFLTIEISSDIKFSFTIICVAFLISNILIFSFYYHNKQLNSKYLETQTELQKEQADKQFYKLFDEQNENQKILIHDIRKHLDVMRNMIETSNNTDLKDYINEIDKSSALQENIVFCDNHTLNLILGRYYNLFSKDNISFSFSISPNAFDKIQVSDITSLFSNLFENAYEATLNSESAYIDFSVKYSQEDSQTTVNLINTYLVEPKKTSNNLFATTKSDEIYHGFGIKSIKKIVDKYNGMYNFYTDETDKTFHVNLVLENTNA